MSTPKRIVSFIVSVGASAFLYSYLNETMTLWRIMLALLLFFAVFILLDGFLRRD